MYFLYPAMLWGLWGLLIPLLVHLFSFQRAVRIAFSQVPVLGRLLRSDLPRQRLRRWVLLGLRLLAIIALVLAFAQPYVPPRRAAPLAKEVFLYVDNSASMSNLFGGRRSHSALEEAIRLAQGVVRAYPSDTRFVLLSHTASVPVPQSRTHTLESLSALRVCATPAYSGSGMLKRLFQQLSQANQTKDIYWFSDFQRTAFDSPVDSPLDSLHHWHLAPIALADSANLYIDSIWLEQPFLAKGSPNALWVRLRNESFQDARGVSVRLVLNGRQAAFRSVHVPPFGHQRLRFEYTPDSVAYKGGQFEVQDPVSPFDNTRYVVLSHSPPLRLVELYGPKATPYVAQVYADNERFHHQRWAATNWRSEDVAHADLMILHGVPRISQALVALLRTHLQSGKAAFIIPPDKIDTLSYAALMPKWHLLPKTHSDSLIPMREVKYHAPFFANVFARYEPIIQWPNARALYQWQPNDKEDLIRLDNGQSFFAVSYTYGGPLYAVTAPLNAQYTDLLTHALFVPLLYQIALYGANPSNLLYYSTSAPYLSLSLPEIAEGKTLYLRTQSQRYKPQQRRIGRQYTLFWNDKYPEPGLHTLEMDTQPYTQLAFNLPKAESKLSNLSTREMHEYFAFARHRSLIRSPDTSNALAESLSIRYLWRELLWVALIAFIAEMLLLRYYKRNLLKRSLSRS